MLEGRRWERKSEGRGLEAQGKGRRGWRVVGREGRRWWVREALSHLRVRGGE